jgi:hypothetical protein
MAQDSSKPSFSIAQFLQGSSSPKQVAKLQPSELNLLREGDILLRRGYGRVSDAIIGLVPERYPVTHCGILLRNRRGQWQVLHSISEGKLNGPSLQSLNNYLRESHQGSLIAVRKQGSPAQIAAFIAEARRIQAKNLPFDMGFDHRDSSQLYCLEFIHLAFQGSEKQNLFPLERMLGQQPVLSLANFWESPHFQILFNQFEQRE